MFGSDGWLSPSLNRKFTCKHNLWRLNLKNSPLKVQVRTEMAFLSVDRRKKVRPFINYDVKAVYSGNVIYLPLFVKCDILWYLALLNGDKPPTKWGKKKSQNNYRAKTSSTPNWCVWGKANILKYNKVEAIILQSKHIWYWQSFSF